MAAHHHKPCLVCGKPILGKPSVIAKRKFCSRECRRLFQVGPNNPHWKGGNVVRACERCGAVVEMIPARAETFRFCSRGCLSSWQSSAFSGPESSIWKGGPKASRERHLRKVRPSYSPRSGFSRICKKCGLPGVKKGRFYHADCSPRATIAGVIVRCVDCSKSRLAYPREGKLPVRCKRCSARHRIGDRNSNWKGGITPANQKIRSSDRYKAWRNAVFVRDDFTCTRCGQVGGTLNADHIKPFATHPKLRFTLSNGRTLCLECHKKTPSYLSKGKKVRKKPRQLIFAFDD